MKINFKKSLVKALFAACMTFALLGCSKKNEENTYFVDMDEAVANAKKNNQTILLAVVMPGDDQNSLSFLNKVFFSESFTKEIMTEYTCVLMDFSRQTYQNAIISDGMSEEQIAAANKLSDQMKKNFEFANRLNIQNTPAILLLSKEKYLICNVPYQPESADRIVYSGFKYALENQKKAISNYTDLLSKIDTAKTNLDKVNAIDALYSATPDNGKGLLSDYVKKIVELDEKNESGLTGKYLLAMADEEAMLLYEEHKTEEAVNVYLNLTKNKAITPEQCQQVYLMAAMLYAYSGSSNYDQMLEYLDTAIQQAPEGPLVGQIQNVQQIINQMANSTSEE